MSLSTILVVRGTAGKSYALVKNLPFLRSLSIFSEITVGILFLLDHSNKRLTRWEKVLLSDSLKQSQSLVDIFANMSLNFF